MPHYEWSHTSGPGAESAAYDFVEDALIENSIGSPTKERAWLVLAEAITNALKHGNNFSSEKKVKIALDINSSAIHADIIDEGTGGLEKVSKKMSPDLMSESGRGVDLIRHYCSTVEFSETETGGLKVSLSFKRVNERITKE